MTNNIIPIATLVVIAIVSVGVLTFDDAFACVWSCDDKYLTMKVTYLYHCENGGVCNGPETKSYKVPVGTTKITQILKHDSDYLWAVVHVKTPDWSTHAKWDAYVHVRNAEDTASKSSTIHERFAKDYNFILNSADVIGKISGDFEKGDRLNFTIIVQSLS